MFSLRRPSDQVLNAVLAHVSASGFSYPEIGASRYEILPPGYPVNRHAVPLGSGAEAFTAARSAVRRWAMYDMAWTRLCWPSAPIEPGAVVGVLVRHLALWSFNPCRIVYVVDEALPRPRFGFAIGTLPGHSESGEERFLVEMHGDGSVIYRIDTFARAQDRLARLAPPVVRHYQRRFGRESLEAMRRAVNAGPPR